jgi:hypothetical protein
MNENEYGVMVAEEKLSTRKKEFKIGKVAVGQIFLSYEYCSIPYLLNVPFIGWHNFRNFHIS